MPLEPLFEALIDSEAQELRLEPGKNAYMMKCGVREDMRGAPLSHADLLQMVTSLLSPEAISGLSQRAQSVDRRHEEEDFELEFGKNNGAVCVVIRRKNGHAGPSSSPALSVSVPAPVVSTPGDREAMDELLRYMMAEDASDIHLSADSHPVLRVHGEIRFLEDRGKMASGEISKLAHSIMTDEARESFRSKRDADCAYEIPGLSRFRVNVFEDRKGVGTVIRQIPVEILTAEQLGLPPAVLELCFLSKGLVLVTGPTGSGKSTTLAAMVDHINKNRNDHLITIEDPIEFVHENQRCLVNQRQVGSHTQSFKAALRAALREDPDVVLVGELRDLETIAIAIETAETGHLVFGTLHTTTAMGTIDRVIDQFPPDQQAQIRVMLSESLKGVISQVLCKKAGGGRVAALEVLLGNSAVSSLIREGKTFQLPSIMQTSKNKGMITMNDSLFKLVKDKLIEPKEAWVKSTDKTGLIAAFKNNRIPVDFVQADAPK